MSDPCRKLRPPKQSCFHTATPLPDEDARFFFITAHSVITSRHYGGPLDTVTLPSRLCAWAALHLDCLWVMTLDGVWLGYEQI
ncbi:hypothetical protein BaRGS_00031797 [Batillaria attramentaria]|uniref:Uncharacterized protein n=1 Tax=Batillaria attramentaria TaxID=370345 RepID=A0ABD0JQR0_9CAEN